MKIGSPDFSNQGSIPRRFTCEGEDLSPALQWSEVPREAASLVLIVDDPDAPDPRAPRMVWVHWILYNMPSASTGLQQGVRSSQLPAGTLGGVNDWKKSGYGGPCPPIGRHRYFFKLYALDSVLPDLGEPKKSRLEQAMKNRIVDQAELVGTYEKER